MKIVAAYPMSEMQRGIAYECELHSDDDVYISQMIIKLNYDNLGDYKKAWQYVINKYEIFKTKFVFGDLKDDIQIVLDEGELIWKNENWMQQELKKRADREKNINLSEFPLMKFTQVTTEEETYLIWTFHHILLDGWSMSLTLQEVDRVYDCLQKGEQLSDVNDTLYSEYVAWKLTNEKSNKQEFWANYLSDYQGFAFPEIARTAASSLYDEVLAEVTVEASALVDYCKKQKVSPAVFFQTLWACLLSCYTSKEEILFEVIDSGRSKTSPVDLEKVVGIMIENHPKRVGVSRTQTFEELLDKVKMDDIELKAYNSLSASQGRKIMGIATSSPYSNSTFVFENYPLSEESFRFEIVRGSEMSTSDLTFSAGFSGNSAIMKLMFSTGVVDKEQAKAILGQVNSWIETVVASDVGSPLTSLFSQIPLSIVHGVKTLLPKETTFFERLLNLSKSHPEKVAVYDEEKEISYEELIKKTAFLIDTLYSLPIGAGESAGIYLPRSAESIILMSALQYLGIPYIYLDDKNNQDRLEYIIEDANVGVILKNSQASALDLTAFPTILQVDISELFDSRDTENGPLRRKFEQPSFCQLIYTSGSSGKPKGIEMTAENILSFAVNNGFYEVEPAENFAQAASMAFDASIFEVWLPLLNGASVTIIPNPVFDIFNWNRKVLEREITTAWLTSGLFNTFVDLDFSLLGNLRKVYVGGEVVSPSHIKKAMTVAPKARFFNGYGPTENTTFTTTFEIPENFDATKPCPIGKLLGNSDAIIINEENFPVPLGVPGELIVSGSGLTNGYYNNIELTNQTFTEICMGEKSAAAYRTGDIVYYDGENFHYIGRKDNQIKLRGFRIELGEIEYALTQLKEIEQAAAVLNESGEQAKEIEVFYVGSIDEKSVARLLLEKLPPYMLPKHYHQVEVIPLTINGKVDKRRLLSEIAEMIPDTSEIQMKLEIMKQFEEVFVKYVSIDKLVLERELFEYGIDSLIAVKLNHELNKVFDKQISLRQFIESENIEQLIQLYSEEPAKKLDDQQLELKTDSVGRLAKATEMQKSMYYFQMENPDLPIYNIPFVKEYQDTSIDPAQMKERFLDIVTKNSIFQSYLKDDSDGTLGWFKREDLLTPIYEYSVTTVRELEENIKNELNYSFSLQDTQESLIRMTMIHHQSSVWLILIAHHIIADGSSMEILLNELTAESGVSENKGDYFDYLNRYHAEDNHKNLEYWNHVLSDIQPNIDFPKTADFYFDHQGGMVNIPLNRRFIEKMNIVAKEEKVSKYILALTFYSQFLMTYYNQNSIIVGTPVSIRPNDYQDVYGMYLSFLPYASRRDSRKKFKEILTDNKCFLFEVIDHATVEYHDLEKMIGTNNSSDGLSFIQTVLNYQEVSDENRDAIKDVAIVAGEHRSSQFPITATFYEAQENSFIQVEYGTGLFTEKQIIDLMETFIHWFDRGLESLDRLITELPVFTNEQSNELVRQLNPTFTIQKQPLDSYLTAISPDNQQLAIMDGEHTLTYAQVFEHIESLVKKLRASGLQKGDKIVFFGQRCWQQVLLFYTCLQYEFVYVPIDVKHSQARLEQINEEIQPNLIFYSDVSLKEKITNGCSVDRMFVEDRFVISEVRGRNMIKDLAYILFTSGTTGKPKGVQISRRNLANFAATFAKDYKIEQNWRIVFLSSISFDASIMDMMTTLVLGNTLYIFNKEHQFLADYIKEHSINFMIITPTLFNVLDFDLCDSLRLIISGGDKFRTNRTLPSHVRVLNGYGPTEATICVSFADKNQELTVGRPVSNSCVVITDEAMNVLAKGNKGEICVVGPSVMESYLNPADNQDRLLPVPKYLQEFGEILYRTGDFGFFDEHGNLHYLGRNDNQVKIRGHRIELSEISERVLQFPTIKEAYTKLITNSRTGQENIGLYVTLEKDALFSEEKLKGFLCEYLPTYMIPDAIVQVEEFKLTVNGKINIAELPIPDFNKTGGQIVSATNELEELLLNVWKQVFQMDEISVLDNYYDLGGDSIKSIQVVSKLREQQIQLSIKEIIKYQNIKSIAKHLGLREKSTGIFDKGEQLTEFPITPVQQWFYSLKMENQNYWNQSNLLIVKLADPDADLTVAFQRIYEMHPMLRGRISNRLGELKVTIVPLQKLDFVKIIQPCESKEAFNKCRENLQNGLDLTNGPTSKLAYYVEQGKAVIYWVVHHLFIDVYSWEILQKDLIKHLENKVQFEHNNDLSTDEYVIRQQRKPTDSFEVLTNKRNQLYQGDYQPNFFEVKKNELENSENINLTLLFSSLFFENILKTTGKPLAVYQERNARFTDSLEMFDLSQSVGWMTEFSHRFIEQGTSCEDIYAALTNDQRVYSKGQAIQAVFLNAVILSDGGLRAQEDYEPSDIAPENMKEMPPMLNIISDKNGLSISIVNIRESAALYKETLKQMKALLLHDSLPDYYRYIESVGKAVVSLAEYEKIMIDPEVDTIYPLFPLQEEIIYSSSGTSESYMNNFAWTTTVPIMDLVARFNQVVRKYEALRTVIHRTSEYQFVQLIYKESKSFPYHLYDLRSQSSLKQKSTIEKLIENEAQMYRGESSEYLHGLYLFQINDWEVRVVWIFNHLIIDGWSVGLIIRVLWNEEDMKEAPNSNLDYVKWLLKNERPEETASSEEDMGICGKIGRLFTTKTKLSTTDVKNLEKQFTLSAELSQMIEQYVRGKHITVANLMNVVWGYVLCRLTDSETVVFGMVDSGRNCPVDNIELKVGLFIRTIASIFTIDSAQRIEDFIQSKSQKVTSQLYQGKQNIQILRKKLKLKPEDELYETLLVVENYPEAASGVEEITDVEANEQSNYLLSLSVGLADKLIYKVAYNSEIMQENSVLIIGQWIEAILQTMVEAEGATVAELPDWSDQILISTSLSTEKAVLSEHQSEQNVAIDLEQIRGVWEKILEHTEFGDEDDFFEIGGDSLKLSKMIFLLREDYQYELNVLKFFENPTLQFLKHSGGLSIHDSTDGDTDENILVPEIHPSSVIENNVVLVTGATGLLGSEIVYQSLKQGKEVYCIVRGTDRPSATRRLLAKLSEIKSTGELLNLERLHVFNGDLSKEKFGLALSDYHMLSTKVSTIYHCAGNVNFMASMKEACEVNVQGLAKVMEFAQKGRLKKVNHVSTLSVVGHDHYIIEDVDLAPISYVKSKVLAEHYLREYREFRNGIHVSRIGRIAGNSRTFSVPEQDLFWRLIVSIAQLGCCPDEFLPFETDLTPVDFIVKELINRTESSNENQVVNYFSNCMISFGRCIKILEEVLGNEIAIVSYEQWLERAEFDSNENQIKVLVPLFRENVFYEPEENSVITENSPDKLIQEELHIEEKITDEVVKCYLKNILQKVIV
ncbi:D-alanine--poly(phosphoribitol) ligase subunit DltA [Bacillus cytotoxicus]|uniref:D-alanine--poly(phosphoribitol) ligase subunit DltA n=1 Tax=Bacillus cytotoxicus TaxID=580165 RepID=UPI0008645EF1|nr:D-alanine--poly(phosphoribitol) ligase subunit DltA [Bacillus cytotoxicus]MDH2860093.1 D-alanine--poly(phosphoribitol) ligase subunit DltA [Bacillus cytotoxicus]MDH2867753.1 D-alanine--poly(phosphoribitol) ligase subunit DltA [Bacillus cytotoxicus]MDH2872207.1 D-alanine--poly(phosphoribitol) ligase subunit DltA [Bacillus cytotoxicus]MDH2875636.1 D-alanine--poly(phosphoribitol) ligase subunit DltA [Bacillus cytotoxicus]MDH2891654.1 D-alanine--poly(phosphoribitol) ligase subunit DltA [Bacillu